MAENQCDDGHVVQKFILAGVTIVRCIQCRNVVTLEYTAMAANHSIGGVMCK